MGVRARSVIDQLADPATYLHRPASVEVKETHISWVFLAGDYVYKLKKPVKFDFLDFSTLPFRERACRDEVRLNQRLAPHCYLGVLPISVVNGRVKFGDEQHPSDWLVHMRRLPAELTLDQLLAPGKLRTAAVDDLAETLARFYRGQRPSGLSATAYLDRCTAHIRENRRELLSSIHGLATTQVQRVHAAQLQLLLLQPDLFAARVQAGRVIEGHGDLRPEHIYFTNPITIIDCIEFSEEFRTIDPLDELAFLASECDHLNGHWVGQQLRSRYEALTSDEAPPQLWQFYKSYRACVRAKVAALRAEQQPPPQREVSLNTARAYLQQADVALEASTRPLTLLVGGLSGTGKSTLARKLSEVFGAQQLRSDVVRQVLFANGRCTSGIDQGTYEPNLRARVYDEMLQQAATCQAERLPVVMDATYQQRGPLLAAHQQALQKQTSFLAIECVCPESVALQRISRRSREGTDPSQANSAVYWQQRQNWERWPDEIPTCQIDTTQAITDQVAQVIAALQKL